MMTFEDLIQAYTDCRRHKRSGREALAFEVGLEDNLMALWRELRAGTYRPGRSRCFIIGRPVRREVFAAEFRDRVVQHLLVNRIEPVLDRGMIHDSYSCRKGRGTLYGVRRIRRFIAQCSEGYTRDCYVLKCDLRGFFMSIDRGRLADMLERTLEREYAGDEKAEVLALTRLIALYDPVPGARVAGPVGGWRLLPPDKSLFAVSGRPMPGGVRSPFPVPQGGKGLPIGNLTSQLFANFYLTPFDHYVKHTLGVRYYGRYADDFVIVHPDREYLRELVPLLERFLRDELGLTLHPRKRWLQHYARGVSFLGVFIRRDAVFAGRRTKEGLYRTVGRWNALAQERALERCDLEAFRSSVNSYWGLMRHHSSYRLRRCSAERFCPELTAVTGQVGYRKVTLSDPRRRAKRKRRKEISRIECMKINADRYEK